MHAFLAMRTGAKVLTSDLYPERHAIAARFGLKNPIHAGQESVVSGYWPSPKAVAPMP